MRLGGEAAYAVEVHNRNEVHEAITWASQRQLDVIVVGTGSNIVWRDDGFSGLLIINRIKGYEDFIEDDTNHYITIGSGELWDNVVQRSVNDGLTGVEALSLIPGTAGATPIQNVGAYGQEISQTLVGVEAYDIPAKKFVSISQQECAFGYRTSRFKTVDRSRYVITAITVHLLRDNPQPPFYPLLQTYLDEHQISERTPSIIRDAVINIRQNRLPDPAKIANNGSFFANPVIDKQQFGQLLSDYPVIPHWEVPKGVKIPAAWLIEQAGFKNAHDSETGMATWQNQALILVNEHAGSTADLLKFRNKIVQAVQDKFNITLIQEPELLP